MPDLHDPTPLEDFLAQSGAAGYNIPRGRMNIEVSSYMRTWLKDRPKMSIRRAAILYQPRPIVQVFKKPFYLSAEFTWKKIIGPLLRIGKNV